MNHKQIVEVTAKLKDTLDNAIPEGASQHDILSIASSFYGALCYSFCSGEMTNQEILDFATMHIHSNMKGKLDSLEKLMAQNNE